MTSNLYDRVNALWVSHPPITSEEARRAAKRLKRKFKVRWRRDLRRCWVSLKGRRSDKGWHRLVHDISHMASREQFPRERPHGPHHAKIEREMVEYVLAQGWLDGRLRKKAPTPKPKTDGDKVARLHARVALWDSKRRRAENALKKLAKSIRYYENKAARDGQGLTPEAA